MYDRKDGERKRGREQKKKLYCWQQRTEGETTNDENEIEKKENEIDKN